MYLSSGSQPVNKLCESNCIYFTQNRHSNVKGKLSEVMNYKTKFFMQYKGKVFSAVIMGAFNNNLCVYRMYITT